MEKGFYKWCLDSAEIHFITYTPSWRGGEGKNDREKQKKKNGKENSKNDIQKKEMSSI